MKVVDRRAVDIHLSAIVWSGHPVARSTRSGRVEHLLAVSDQSQKLCLVNSLASTAHLELSIQDLHLRAHRTWSDKELARYLRK